MTEDEFHQKALSELSITNQQLTQILGILRQMNEELVLARHAHEAEQRRPPYSNR